MKKSTKTIAKKNIFEEPAFVLIFSITVIFGTADLFIIFFGDYSSQFFVSFLTKLSIPFLVWTLYMYLMDCKQYSFLVGFIIALITFFLL